jgi:hypothetical protein
LAQAFDHGVDAYQGRLENIGQVRGIRHRIFGVMVAGGCHHKREVDRVVHGGILSLRESIHPLLKEGRRFFTSLFCIDRDVSPIR